MPIGLAGRRKEFMCLKLIRRCEMVYLLVLPDRGDLNGRAAIHTDFDATTTIIGDATYCCGFQVGSLV